MPVASAFVALRLGRYCISVVAAPGAPLLRRWPCALHQRRRARPRSWLPRRGALPCAMWGLRSARLSASASFQAVPRGARRHFSRPRWGRFGSARSAPGTPADRRGKGRAVTPPAKRQASRRHAPCTPAGPPLRSGASPRLHACGAASPCPARLSPLRSGRLDQRGRGSA